MKLKHTETNPAMTEPLNVASIVATALQGARSRLQWLAESEGLSAEEHQATHDLITDLEGFERRWGPEFDFNVHVRPEDLV